MCVSANLRNEKRLITREASDQPFLRSKALSVYALPRIRLTLVPQVGQVPLPERRWVFSLTSTVRVIGAVLALHLTQYGVP